MKFTPPDFVKDNLHDLEGYFDNFNKEICEIDNPIILQDYYNRSLNSINTSSHVIVETIQDLQTHLDYFHNKALEDKTLSENKKHIQNYFQEVSRIKITYYVHFKITEIILKRIYSLSNLDYSNKELFEAIDKNFYKE